MRNGESCGSLEYTDVHGTFRFPLVPWKPGGLRGRRLVWVGIFPTGEEEVKVTESETPVLTGVWCKRELLRR